MKFSELTYSDDIDANLAHVQPLLAGKAELYSIWLSVRVLPIGNADGTVRNGLQLI